MKKTIPIVIAVVLIGGSFYGGMLYGQSKNSIPGSQNFQGNVGGNFQRGINRESGATLLNGEVTSKDEQSLTLKTNDGSSKIIFFSASTQISKMAEGTVSDVEIGKQIMVTGQQNSDGSYTAKTIQLSPRSMTQ